MMSEPPPSAASGSIAVRRGRAYVRLTVFRVCGRLAAGERTRLLVFSLGGGGDRAELVDGERRPVRDGGLGGRRRAHCGAGGFCTGVEVDAADGERESPTDL